jgi:16S rRNA (guanine1516-N2)-methyltransferase
MKLLHAPRDRGVVAVWGSYFELVDTASAVIAPDELHLRFANGELRLHRGTDRRGIGVDSAELARRGRGDLALARACGGAARGERLVVDATAGLGTDALALEARGFQVALIEREPALWALLDSHLRAAGPVDVGLFLGDACDLLRRVDTPWQGAPAVVYIDTMFPESGKSALPGKRMQYLRQLLEGMSDDAAELLAVALDVATERVVVKRRLRDPALAEPAWQIRASSIRYDVYRPERPPAAPLSSRA